MLEECNSCQVRDTSYYTYLQLRLSRHCGWLVLGAPMYLDERKTVCVLDVPPDKFRENAV